MTKTIFALLFTCCLFLSSCSSQKELATVDTVDLERYSGKWYEVASFPNRFQKDCTCTSATYTIKDDYVEVLNKCFRPTKGGWKDIKGKAFPVKNTNNTKLKVQFFPPFKGDYYIIELDKDYEWAVVGSPSRKYLWFLSRGGMNEALMNELKEKVSAKGFDVSLLNETSSACD